MATQNSNFNPESYGAIPVSQSVSQSVSPAQSSNSTFNPESYGAIPIKAPLGPVNALATPNETTALENNSAYKVAKWFPDTISTIENQAVNAAAAPVQAVGDLLSLATGDHSFASASNQFLSGVTDVEGRPINVTPLNNAQDASVKAGDIASTALMALAPESSGFWDLAKLGGAQGVANSMAQGNPILSPATAENLGIGFVFGGTLGIMGNIARSIGNVEKASTGVDSQLTNDLKLITPKDLGDVINVAQKTNESNFNPTAADWLGDKIESRAEQLQTVVKDTGKRIGDILKTDGNTALVAVNKAGQAVTGTEAVDNAIDQINDVIQTRTGGQLSRYASGETEGLQINNYPQGPSVGGLTATEGESAWVPLPGRPAVEAPPVEQRTFEWLSNKLATLRENPTVQTAHDIMQQLDIDWASRDKYGPQTDRMNTILQQTYGILNSIVRPASPELAIANDTYSGLRGAQKVIIQGAGNQLQNLDLLLRRVQYGGKSAGAQTALDVLDNAINLSKTETPSKVLAVAARYARDTYENGISRNSGGAQALQQEKDLVNIVAGYTRIALQSAVKLGRKIMLPNPQEYAMSLAKGEEYSFIPLVHNIDRFLDSPASNPLKEATQDVMRKLKISSNNVGYASLNFIKAMMIHNLAKSYVNQVQTNPLSTPGQQQAPSLTPQNSTSSQPMSVVPQSVQQSAVKSLTPASSGQAMSAQMRKGGLSNMPNGMNLGNAGLSLT